ncbi:hypothetical protein DID80_04825 [Candidatus Marinamargulisbacteria bacterium SCGC AAA071-K20]|nr:hypothetical protein DID80_04825 [Candidatus Marinamargulisbacteria bacterium SCGC AAA071-K20]
MPSFDPTIFEKSLQIELNKLKTTLKTEISTKNNSLEDLLWCLKDSSQFLSFLSLQSIGRNKIEKASNFILFRVNKKLWKRSIYKKVTLKIINSLKTRYLPREFKDYDNKHELSSVAEHKIMTFFDHCFGLLTKGSLIDMMNLSSQSLKCIRAALKSQASYYIEEKKTQDRLCLRTYKEVREEVIKHPYNLLLATLIAVKANFIDSAIDDVNTFLYGFFDEINEWIDSDILALVKSNDHPHFDYYSFINKIEKNKHSILYELDNCGEVIFDLLLVELLLLKGHQVTLCAKLHPVLNDVTEKRLTTLLDTKILSHLKKYIQNKQLSIIHSNSGNIGKSLFEVSDTYKNSYKKADCLILKGQGNFLNMPMNVKKGRHSIAFEYSKPIFYLFTVKSEIIEYAIKESFEETRPEKNELVLKYYQS